MKLDNKAITYQLGAQILCTPNTRIKTLSNPKKTKSSSGRSNTPAQVKRLVWTRAAGHCELCGTDLTHDFRIGKPMKWGEVAHILPASPKGPRALAEYDNDSATAFTSDDENLMLLCPSCHEKIDLDEKGYPKEDLTQLHQDFVKRIRLAATAPSNGKAIALIVQSEHFQTVNDISTSDFLSAMSAEGLTAFGHPIKICFRQPGPRGRDSHYWQSIKDDIQYQLKNELRKRGGSFGDAPALAVVGLADIPALIQLGQAIGDRSQRLLYSFNRESGLAWPDQAAAAPKFICSKAPDGAGPVALVLSISAYVPHRDVKDALPDARIAEFAIPEPSYMMVKNRQVINEFRKSLQIFLSQIESQTSNTIHVFAAIPAALAIEFGALLTTEHQHPYLIFDRDRNKNNQFQPVLQLGSSTQETS